MIIDIASNDGQITNRDEVIVTISKQMSARLPNITLTTNGEGPCAHELGLYELLDYLCNSFDYPRQQIYIQTCNLIETHNEYNIVYSPQMVYLNQAREKSAELSKFDQKNFDDIKTFGNFIGHGNLHRIHLASYLNKNYSSQTLSTYHCDVELPYHRPFLGIEDMMFSGYNDEQINTALELLRKSPIKIDSIDDYPILLPATLNIFKLYPNFFVEIANVTYFSGNTFYIDEKLWRPMLAKTPFIVQGPQNFLTNLKKLGFKTFSDFWDEGYQEDPASHQPFEIIRVIDNLAKLSKDELESMYKEMLPILEHNKNRAMSITREDFINL